MPLDHPKYKAATGLSIAQFNDLYSRFELFYSPKELPRYAEQVQPVLTDKREALFFILHYYKAYPTLQNLGIYFGISDSTASAYLESLKPCLKAALQQQSSESRGVFKSQAAFDKQFAEVTDLLIDVTEVPIERAVNQQLSIG